MILKTFHKLTLPNRLFTPSNIYNIGLYQENHSLQASRRKLYFLFTTNNYATSLVIKKNGKFKIIKRKAKEIYNSKKCMQNGRFVQAVKGEPVAQINEFENEKNSRVSELNIQMLSHSLHKQLFRSDSFEHPTKEDIKKSILHLKCHDLWGREPHISPDVEFELPPLKGNNLKEHFYNLGQDYCETYKHLVNILIESQCPSPPSKFSFSEGWTKYYEDGTFEKVDFPSCSSLVFDIEVCLSEGKHPTMATAVSDKYWYSWCAPSFINGTKIDSQTLEDLISFGNITADGEACPRIIVGHNVSFDRLSIKEEYYIEDNCIRFVDTMALHIAVSGLIEEQRNFMNKYMKSSEKIKKIWMDIGCMNNLKDILKFYCNEEHQKDARDIFVKGSIEEVRENFQGLMHYCASDVIATCKVLEKVYPLFMERLPHPVSFSGMLEMGKGYLPVCSSWNKYINLCEEKFNELNASLTAELVQQAQKALKLQENEKYKLDPWLWDLDWNFPKGHVKQLKNYPNWYRKLCMRTKERDNIDKPQNMSISLQIVPKLLNLTWNGFPLHYERNLGWGYLKSIKKPLPLANEIDESSDTETFLEEGCEDTSTEQDKNLFPYESLLAITEMLTEKKDNDSELPGFDIGIPNVIFYPLPHKDGEGKRVGNPLSKHFLSKIEDSTLSSAVRHIAELVLKTTKTISYWKNNRDRILSQNVMHLNSKCLPSDVTNSVDFDVNEKYGAILPQIVAGGTITRRAVDKTWMTASNAYLDRIGSELKGIIKSPPGYHFVGADVDSQELWIASVLGDAYYTRQHGSTALGWMTLQGNKAQGTDMHSVTAKTVGISRDHAKVINYGRIYGAGMKFMKQLLKQFNPSLSDHQTEQRAKKLFKATKGQKGWYLNERGRGIAAAVGFGNTVNQPFSRGQINQMLMSSLEDDLLTWRDVIDDDDKPIWIGGSESHMFNCLESIARMEKPETPVLGARITRALEPWYVGDDFMTSRVNWVVQSSAVDYLHLMLVSMRWLFKEYKIKGRFSISIHDEVRYLVATEDRYRAALALQITNLLTRSFISLRLGLNDLPQSVAFFSGVDVDKVLRKEPTMDCVTPSNPEGLSRGYNIQPGETLDIYKILEKSEGKLTFNGER